MKQRVVEWEPTAPVLGAPALNIQTAKRTTDDVTVQIVQNFAGAVGVAGLGAMAAWAVTGGNWQAAGLAGVMAGAGVFFAALAVRSFIDEGRLAAHAVRAQFATRGAVEAAVAEWEDALAECELALCDALAEIDHWRAMAEGLRTDRDMATAELQQYRAQMEVNYRSKASLYDKARRDAKALMQLTLTAGAWLARDTALEKLQWQRGRWEDAFALLKDAGCVQQHGAKGNHVRILISDLTAAYAAIDQHTGAVSLSEE